MENINLKILEKQPELDKRVTLEIDALAPLSMNESLPGSFYKSLKSPSEKMLCGLFENILGWHLSVSDRMTIQKDLIKVRKKQKINIEKPQKGSTYIPLLMEYFKIDLVIIPEFDVVNDLWNKSFRRSDAVVHPNGTMNIDYRLIPEKRAKKRDEKNLMKINPKELEKLFKENLGSFPLYYSSPSLKEYIIPKGNISLTLSIDEELLNILENKIDEVNTAYLGNSEGWVHLNLKNHE